MFSTQQSLKTTVGNMEHTTVVTDKVSDEASSSPSVIAATPEIIAAIKKAS
jgi:hypothetical protein